ncbi:UPF0753 protein YbcC [Mycobacterium marinum]|uniref:DUF2309 domain-containing protein n=1 Tax=Mycobacterium marinum TaxID=1781 RepID=UPI0021C335B2|nr:DUF2309 domain-containing protein [Mycobacterium marinum]GJO03277.1 UPF0753 protein YbcC [Mycobacterium marinum]GJO08621.1 UPF0753 protein YbcC [Mycobacterium marinum]GJO13871.1 UPF0753 protein YbcC [Mycobacterium marinum]GJO25204.1 UPF0753 protein YbcC [Mycobacterium marinum]GJO27886.1 UPF0753 protein YbcC [Mycobacterium marinum]
MTTLAEHVSIDTRRAQLRSDVNLATRVIPTHYPLETFIAVNPLAGLESMPFDQAVRRAGDLYGSAGVLDEAAYRNLYRLGRITDADLETTLRLRYPALLDGHPVELGKRTLTPAELLRADLLNGSYAPKPVRRNMTRSEQAAPQVAEEIDAQAAKWCMAYFGSPAAGWPMPGHGEGFYHAWRTLAAGDHKLSRRVRAALREAPRRADDAALQALTQLGVADEGRVTYLQAHLTRLPGWAAHVRWSAEHATGVGILDYLAMRLTYEAIMLAHNNASAPRASVTSIRPRIPSARERAAALARSAGIGDISDNDLGAAARVLSALPVTSRQMIWQQAYEAHYRDALLSSIAKAKPHYSDQRPAAQLVCCIDTRSEGLRRHFESLGQYETLGFAGFFAVAIRFTGLLGGTPNDLCPVLIRPQHEVSESPAPAAGVAARRRRAGSELMASAESAFHVAKQAPIAPFALAEAAGWAAGPWAAAKTLSPSGSGTLRRRLRDRLSPRAPTVLSINDTVDLAQRSLYAQVALTTMGLTNHFARLVVLCGHGSITENNPYQAALDCGACGGQAGGPNARTAAAILNDADVRAELRNLGIEIPDDTRFIAAQHDTATDRIDILDQHLIPAGYHADIQRLITDLGMAGTKLATERCFGLPGGPANPRPAQAARHVAKRSLDWAQVFPEWGLAGNAAFIVAPRAVTRGMNLQRRAFLHSYEAEVDADGSALETILTAPMVVAQWINCQYYFSTVAPEMFGAGTKTIHNVVGGVGVLAGHGGDLQLGLPRQSLTDGQAFGHEPMRLLTVVQAPLKRIDMVVERNPILQHLFGNDWVCLAAREHPGQSWRRWTRGDWRRWDTNGPTDHNNATDQEVMPCQ